MSNSEHLATVMVNAFIDAVDRGVDLVPVVADSTSTAKIAPFMQRFPGRLVNVGIAEQSGRCRRRAGDWRQDRRHL